MDPKAKSKALKKLPYGFYVLSTASDGKSNAFAMTWAMQIAFEPTLVAVAVDNESYSHHLVGEGGVFALNIFSKEQPECVRPFLRGYAADPDKLSKLPHEPGETGSPIFTDAIAFVECRVVKTVDAGGDHTLFIGEVVNAGVRDEAMSILAKDMKMSYAG